MKGENLEKWVKLASTILLPVILVWLGFLVQDSLGSKDRLVDKRLEVYDQVGPTLNDIYVFIERVGHYKDLKQEDVVQRKRQADKTIYSTQAIWSPQLITAYKSYTDEAFETWIAEGVDAQPRQSSANHRRAYQKLMLAFGVEFR